MSSDDKKNNDNQTEQLLKQILTKVNSDEFKIGLDKLSKDVADVKTDLTEMNIYLIKVDSEIDKIKNSGDERAKTLQEVHNAIYHPFVGIYSKLSGNEAQFKEVNGKLATLEQNLTSTKTDLSKDIAMSEDKLEEKIGKFNTRLDSTEGKIKLLTNIAGGETFADAKDAIDAHKNFNKLWWALVLAVVSGFGKFIWDVVKEFNQ